MYKVVLLRHGESTWNKENIFTGWTDVDLDERGVEQAKRAAQLLKEGGYDFDVSYTSFLKRAIRTLWIVLDEMNLMWIPEYKSWRLNERHYGALQGLNKADTAQQYGEDQVKLWRRCYEIEPPALAADDQRDPSNDSQYDETLACVLPHAESLEDTFNRVFPYWVDDIMPEIHNGKQVIVVAHGNTLRALVKHLDNLSNEQVMELNIPVGQPLVYELDEHLMATKHYYLASDEEIQAGVEAVVKQATSEGRKADQEVG